MEARSNERRRKAMKQTVWIAQLQGLRRHLPAMQTTQSELGHSARQLPFTGGTATRCYAMCSLKHAAELHAVALQALAQGSHFSAHTPAQDASRLAVNTIYVLSDPDGDRFAAARRHLVDAQAGRFAAWEADASAHRGTHL